MRTLLTIMLIALALPAGAQSGRDWPDCSECEAWVLDSHPFTITPCGGDEMPVIDILLVDEGNNPIELIASDIWLDSPPGNLEFCGSVVADSSTFRPDPGHTTMSGEIRGGLGTLNDCAAVRVDMIAFGSVFAALYLQVNSPDLSGDQRVTVADFGLFAGRFQTNDPCADYDESGFVSVADFGLFAGWFGDCVCAR